MSDAPAITVDLLPTDAVLLDVREPAEWAAGHVEGATHVPMGEVPIRVGELPAAAPLYVICRSGKRSGEVVLWLAEQGIDSVNVAGGMQAWAAAGRAMVSQTGATPIVA